MFSVNCIPGEGKMRGKVKGSEGKRLSVVFFQYIQKG